VKKGKEEEEEEDRINYEGNKSIKKDIKKVTNKGTEKIQIKK
jgi:hypothetical protein